MRSYFNIILLFIVSISFSQYYDIGDQVTMDHQSVLHSVCYGAEHHGIASDGHGGYSLSLSDYNGYINDSGVFYVMMIDMAASW
tara:strand:- start:2192 stop:2443 length:252 start_codon:yes stop_codon:yes gene_type:complete